jgi:hypothetical protein
MTNFAVMGSCVAGISAMFLVELGWKRINVYHALRSEHFVRYFIDREPGLPPHEEMLAMVDAAEEHRERVTGMLRDNYPDLSGDNIDGKPVDAPFLKNLIDGKIDVLLMDNWHEPNMHYVVTTDSWQREPFGMVMDLASIRQDLRHMFTGRDPLHMPEMARSWNRIVRFVREVSPHTKMFFFCSHYITSTTKPERYRTFRDFFLTFRDMTADLGIHVIPPLQIDLSLTKVPDEAHYDMNVYRALGNFVWLAYNANWPSIGTLYQMPGEVHAV